MKLAENKRLWLATATTALALSVAIVAGCAPQTRTAAPETGPEADEPTIEVAWSPESDCATCHTNEGETMGAIPCTAGGEAECITCHADTASLESVHANATATAKMPKKLKKTEVSAEACETCHGSTADLAAQTADSTAFTDSKGTVVNPHALPENDKHANIVCTDCHNPHAGTPQETGPKACATCHHAGVYECGTCHEER